MDGPGSEILFSRDPLIFTSPKIIQVNGYGIRDFQVHATSSNKARRLAPYEENDDLVDCAEIDGNFDVKVTQTNEFVVEFHVPRPFCGSVIGFKGSVRRKIEQDTRTTITVPRQGENGLVTITGGSERDVVMAKNRIDLIVWQARDKHQLTHFVSIPMVSDMIKHNFEIFKTSLLTGTLIRGLDASMFQNPNKLHITIATLVLVDEFEQKEATKALERCKNDLIIPIFSSVEPLRLSLQGLEIMNDDPTNVDVLYGKVTVDPPKYNDCLQMMADGIVDYLAERGLVRKQYDHVKLHVTLINSLFRKASNPEQKQKREPFDATVILNKYRSFQFGEADFDFVHLSVRFTTSEGSYYDALMTVPIK